jgi:hypothetical protein
MIEVAYVKMELFHINFRIVEIKTDASLVNDISHTTKKESYRHSTLGRALWDGQGEGALHKNSSESVFAKKKSM